MALRSIFCFFLLLCLQGCHDQNGPVSFPGYAEGRMLFISTHNTGTLKSLLVSKGETVKAGQLLFILKDPAAEYDVQNARERVAQAKEQENQLEKEYDFQKKNAKQSLPEEKLSNQSQSDQAYANLQAGRKNVAALRANFDKADWYAKQNEVRSPENGLVFDTYYQAGEWAQAGTPILSLLDPNQIKIIFYLPETQLSKARIAQKIQVHCDGCVAPIFAQIRFISPQPEYSPPVIYSNEARQKLVYRIEAVLSNPAHDHLHPGQPVTVRIIEKP